MAANKKALEGLSKGLMEEVRRWGSMKQTGVSLRYMMEFGSQPTPRNLLISAQFLHKELPIRIARRAIELDSLPYGLSHKPAVLKVRDWYLDSFRDLRSFRDIKDNNDEVDFTQMIKMIKVRHNNVVPMMALGVQQLKKDLNPKINYMDFDEIHQFLDRFYMSRIGIRMLIGNCFSLACLLSCHSTSDSVFQFYLWCWWEVVLTTFVVPFAIMIISGQHVALHDPNPLPDCVGYIHTKMSPLDVARSASEDARFICLREYGSAPEVNIYGDPNFTFPYVPTHLHLMVFELVKNSLRAVQERFMDSDKVSPPVRIIVADGLEDVTIKARLQNLNCDLFDQKYEKCHISDEGGGIPRSGLPKIFTYLYSTAKNPLDEQSSTDLETPTTMAGYGCGLPISRLYAKYFGGDMQIISMEGYGTDAYLHLSRLGDSQEPLP
ncbi:pyruvate dehydrogenase kinase [Striga asiatica]|uniref:Protein-serine/threonine kinase n=1 Tax=Striga asiatica TaxID=4170 RepID=A0A5A7PFK2_STRAF|nr:pyruvate dehydrogenase kinase [Striga asiatica]